MEETTPYYVIELAKLCSWDGAGARYIKLPLEGQAQVLTALARMTNGQWYVENMLAAAQKAER
jgi:hypothetical protein